MLHTLVDFFFSVRCEGRSRRIFPTLEITNTVVHFCHQDHKQEAREILNTVLFATKTSTKAGEILNTLVHFFFL